MSTRSKRYFLSTARTWLTQQQWVGNDEDYIILAGHVGKLMGFFQKRHLNPCNRSEVVAAMRDYFIGRCEFSEDYANYLISIYDRIMDF